MEIKNSFLAEAIDRLTDLGKKTTEPTTILANGRTFLVTGTSCEEIDPIEKPQPDKATTASLNALVALLRNEVDKEYTHCPLYVSCGWYDRVRVFTQPDEGDDLHRFTLYEAVATDLPPLVEEVRWGFDEAQIKLRSMFQRAPEGDTNDVDYILGLLSHMSVDQSVKSDDNGVTQTVQVRKGVSFVENQRVRPIVKLAPLPHLPRGRTARKRVCVPGLRRPQHQPDGGRRRNVEDGSPERCPGIPAARPLWRDPDGTGGRYPVSLLGSRSLWSRTGRSGGWERGTTPQKGDAYRNENSPAARPNYTGRD